MDRAGAGVCALAFALYINTLGAGFVYDDRVLAMAFAAVFWTKFKNWSVIDSKTICEGEVRPNAIAYALWSNKLEEIRVLRTSDIFNELKDIKVTCDGYIREFNNEKALAEKPASSSGHSKKKERSAKGKNVKAKETKNVNAAKDIFLKPVYDKNKEETPQQDNSDVEHEASEYVLPSPVDMKGSSASPKISKEEPTKPNQNAKSGNQQTGGKAFNPEVPDPASVLLPPASKDVVEYFERLTLALRQQQRGQTVVVPSLASPADGAVSPNVPDTLVELIHGNSTVLINKRKRNTIRTLNRSDPESMIRDLLTEIVGLDKLKTMRARNKGTSVYEPIPKDIMSAVESENSCLDGCALRLPGPQYRADSRAVLRNPDVSSPSSPWLSTLSHDFWGAPLRSSGSHGSYRPLSTLSLRLNAWLDPQLRPAGFHFLNAALHALASWLVLVLGRRLLGPGRSRWAAALAAHLFAAHPVHCEAVAGVVGRADLLCCVCYLLAVLCYLRHVDLRDQRRCRHASTATSRTARARDVPQPSKDIINAVLDRFLLAQEWSPCQPLQQPARRCGQCALRSGALLGAALLLAACATLCKEPGVTVLAVCCVYELLAQLGRRRAAKRPQWRGVLVLVGFSAVLLGARLALVLGRAPRFASADNPAAHSDSLATRTLTFLYLPVVNLRLLLWPYRLSFDWSMEAVPLVQSLWDPRNALSAALYLGLYRLVRVALGHLSTRTTTTTHVFRSGKHRRTTSTSSTASFSSCELTLMCVAVTVLPLLPCTNLFFYVGFVVAERVLYIPSVGFCLLVAVGARRLLDTESTATSPTPPRVVVNLAVLALLLAFSVRTVLRNYDWRDEEALYRSGVDVNPPKAYGNLGSVLSSLNRLSEAEHAFKMALKHRPNMADVHYNLGNLQAKQNQSTAAINSYKQAIRFRPSLALAYVNLGHVLAREGRVSEAVEVLVRCVELPVEGLRDPVAHQSARASALLHLAHVHAGQGNYHLAKSALQLALDIRPSEYQPAPLYELMAEVTDRLNHKPLVVSGTQSACPRTPSPGTSLTAAALPLNESHCGSTDTRRLLSYS